MSNFHMTELEVIRHYEAEGSLKDPESIQLMPQVCAFKVVDLCQAIIRGEKTEISYAMGRVAIDMIVLCAMLDIDLAKSLETAFNKISAKPVDIFKTEFCEPFTKSEVDAIVSEGVILREPYSHIKISGNVIRDESSSTPADTSNVVLLKRE